MQQQRGVGEGEEKVRVFGPDGIAKEQLVGRLVAQIAFRRCIL